MILRGILLKAGGVALAVSLAANAALWFAYRSSLTATADAANERLAAALSHQATEFQRELERRDVVTQDERARREAAERTVRAYGEEMATRRSQDPAYAEWADGALPQAVTEALK